MPTVVALDAAEDVRTGDPFQLVKADGNIMLVHAEKAADAQDNVFNLAGLIDELLDVANFFIGVVVYVNANELGGAPRTIVVFGCTDIGSISRVIVEVCADAIPVISAVLNRAIAINFEVITLSNLCVN